MISSEPATEKAKNDRALRFYRDVLGLERLHYGMWSPDDPLTMEALQAAQKRYEDFLIENVPEGIERILDVGCGTGELCLNLKKKGYLVEGLSPDINQKAVFAEKSKHAVTQKTLQEKEQALADTAKALDEERKLRKQKEAEIVALKHQLEHRVLKHYCH